MWVSAVLVLALATFQAKADFPAPEYTVDMDKSAYERWVPVAESIIGARGYENTWGKLHEFLEKILPRKEWDEMQPLWDLVLASYPLMYQEEVLAYHRWVNEKGHNWTLGQNTMVQLFYEVEDFCTSIVAQHSNGSIFHGRNLDYGLPGLVNFTATVTFTKGGQKIGRGTMYIGYCGLLTGQHLVDNGARATWSVSLDQRFYGKDVVPYVATVEAFLRGVQNVGFTLRDAVMKQPDFASATALLKDKHIPAPAYLILSGTEKDEGVVITRDRNGTSKALGTGRGYWPIDVDHGAWYRLETNFDNWEPITDGRRKAAHEMMDKLGQDKADTDGLFSVLSTPPVCNSETTYTSLMLNEKGQYSTTVRTHDEESNKAREEKVFRSAQKGMQALLAWYRRQPFHPNNNRQ